MDEITVHAPATVANVVCGFDCLGFALEQPYDVMTVRRIQSRIVRIVHHDDFGLTTDPARNVAGIALQAVIDAAGLKHGFEAEITKGIKPGSGIGSSSASACGAVVAANLLIGEPFSKTDLVELAMAGEAIASGSRHADNLAPSIFGGFTLVRSTDPLDVITLEYPVLHAAVIHPQIEIKTSEARAMLPTEVPLARAISNWSNLAAFVAGLQRSDTALLERSMSDSIIEPVRSRLIPLYQEVKIAALEAGAIGGGISGSGPSMFMLCSDEGTATAVEHAMRGVYETSGIPFNTYVSPISRHGVQPA